MSQEETASTGKRTKEETEGAEAGAETESQVKRAKAEAEGGNAAPAGTAKAGEASSSGTPAASVAAILADKPATKAKLEWLYSTGKLSASEMNESALKQLAEFSDSKGVEIVENFAGTDMSGVGDKASFFCGIMKNILDQSRAGAPAPAGFGVSPGYVAPPASAVTPAAAAAGPVSTGPPSGGLWPKVEEKLESLYMSGRLARGELDSRCLDKLRMLSETSGLEVVTKFGEADLPTIKSKGGFFMGIVKRFSEQERGVFASLSTAQFPAAANAGETAFQGCPSGGLWPSAKAKLDEICSRGHLMPNDLDSRCMEQLRTLPEHLAMEVLTKFGEADLASIKSKGGFFMGIVKRFREQVVAQDPTLQNQTFQGLPYLVQVKLETLFSSNQLGRNELDAKCLIELRNLPEIVAMEVLDKFCEAQLGGIRNKTAFFLGIVKRLRAEKGIRGNAGGAPASRPGGSFPAQSLVGFQGYSPLGAPYGGLGMGLGGAGLGDPYQAQLLAAQQLDQQQQQQQQQLQQQLQLQQQQLAGYGQHGAVPGAEGLQFGANYNHLGHYQ